MNNTFNQSTASNTLAKSLLGNNYREVDLTANSVLNVGEVTESSEPNVSTYAVSTSYETAYTFSVDGIGNMTKINDADLNWNGRRLESISQDGTEYISYEYNIDGQRVKKTAPDLKTGELVTTEYFYNGSFLAGQKKGDDVIVFMYDNNGDVFGFEYNGTPYYYVKNAQNDVFLILDEDGMIQVLYQYDSWGKVTFCADATDFGLAGINPIMYRSYYVDLEMGMFMYYLNSRYYMADWGRFLSADNLLDNRGMTTQNLFQYCANNPVMHVDTSGHALESIFDVATLCISIVDVIANPKDPWAWLGLAGDIVDLVPFVTGVGEVARGLKIANRTIDAVDAAYDVARNVDNVADAVDDVADTARTVSRSLQPYYPPNDGFMGVVQEITLPSGTMIQRTGNLSGFFVAPAGTPTCMLSLPYDKVGQSTSILQTQQSLRVLSGQVAPWFDQIGCGIQYKLLDGSLDELISKGAIAIM